MAIELPPRARNWFRAVTACAGPGVAIVHLALSVPVAAQDAATASAVDRGEALAVDHCADCHVISVATRYNGIGNSPSFFVFSERPDRYEPRLRDFQSRLPHPSRQFDLDHDDIDAIISYVRTLERPK